MNNQKLDHINYKLVDNKNVLKALGAPEPNKETTLLWEYVTKGGIFGQEQHILMSTPIKRTYRVIYNAWYEELPNEVNVTMQVLKADVSQITQQSDNISDKFE